MRWSFLRPKIPAPPSCFHTRNCWITPFTATRSDSPVRIMWKRPGGSCSRSWTTPLRFVSTNPVPGDRRRRTRSLRRPAGGGILLDAPHPKTSQEGVIVASQSGFVRQFFQLLHISAAQDDVIRRQRRSKLSDNFDHLALPFLSAQALQAPEPKIIFVSFAVLVGQMRQFHGLEHAI